MSRVQEVTQLPCQVAHISGWSDVEDVSPSPHDPTQLLLRAPHHVGALSLTSSSTFSTPQQLYWHPHRRLTAACWLSASAGTMSDGLRSDVPSLATFAVGDATSCVRVAVASTASSPSGPDRATDADALRSTTVHIGCEALLSPFPTPAWAIRTLLSTSANGSHLLAQRAAPDDSVKGSWRLESASARAPSTSSSSSSPAAALAWVVSTEVQAAWSVVLPCGAAPHQEEVPELMAVSATSHTGSHPRVPEVAVCSSQAITVCRGTSLSPRASFVFNADPAHTASRVLKLFGGETDDNGYTALVHQRRGTRSAIWLAEWDARFPRTPTWWSELAEGEATAGDDAHYHASALSQPRTYAIAALSKNTKRSVGALFTVRAPPLRRSEAPCVAVKPCKLDIGPLFDGSMQRHSVDSKQAGQRVARKRLRFETANGATKDAPGPDASPSAVRAISCVSNVLTFAHFGR